MEPRRPQEATGRPREATGDPKVSKDFILSRYGPDLFKIKSLDNFCRGGNRSPWEATGSHGEDRETRRRQ